MKPLATKTETGLSRSSLTAIGDPDQATDPQLSNGLGMEAAHETDTNDGHAKRSRHRPSTVSGRSTGNSKSSWLASAVAGEGFSIMSLLAS